MWLDKHIDAVVRRSKAFYQAKTPGHFMVNAFMPAEAPRVPPLCDFDLDEQLTEWLDFRLEAARPRWRAKEGLDDDAVPCTCPRFGIAEHSAWLGMEVRLQETTCLPVPLINAPEDLDRVTLSEQDRWFRYMKDGYDHLRSRKDGTFVLSVRGTMGPMDLANAVRGDALFTDVLLDPAFAHKLMAFLVEAIHWYYGRLRSWADTIDGGHVFGYGGGWMGPNCLGHLSNDPAMMCSADIYEQFGFPYERALAEKYESLLYHVHNVGMHYIPRLAHLPGLAMLEVSHDPNTTSPIEDLDEVLPATGSANLMLHGTSDQIRSHIGELGSRNVFFLAMCRDRQDADDLVAFVRDQSKPL